MSMIMVLSLNWIWVNRDALLIMCARLSFVVPTSSSFSQTEARGAKLDVLIKFITWKSTPVVELFQTPYSLFVQ